MININDYDATVIGERIYQERDAAGMTLDELAKKLFCTRQTIAKWEHGDSFPPIEDLIGLCNIFHCDTGYLLGEYDCQTKVSEDISKETGLSETAVNNLVTAKEGLKPSINKEQKYEYIIKAVDYLLRYAPQTLVNIGILLSPVKESGYITPQSDNPNYSLERIISDRNLSDGFLVQINKELQNLRDTIWNEDMPEEVALEIKPAMSHPTFNVSVEDVYNRISQKEGRNND